MPDESVDLIYLDPPFNSNRAYNVIYPDDMGQVQAFQDTWAWTTACDAALQEEDGPGMDMVRALIGGMGQVQMAAYLVMMTPRLAELHRILKPTGSLYLHCDPTASHYLKVIMDAIFGRANFRNEVVWKRFNFHADAYRFGSITDRALFYSRGDGYTFNRVTTDYSEKYIASKFTHRDDAGRAYRLDSLIPPNGRGPVYEFHGVLRAWRYKEERMRALEDAGRIYTGSRVPQIKRYLDEMPGQAVPDLWVDIPPINSQARERLGYPTQKPLALLERIIRASSNPGDVVCDPFCGCGSSIAAAENAGRKWIGIDITYAAIAAIQERFRRDRVDIWKDVEIVNRPETVQEVDDQLLNTQNPLHPRKEFEKFCVASIGGLPNEKMGADGGVDGRIPLVLKKRANVSVKSGNVGVRDMRDLTGTLDDSKDVSGVFVTRQQPTRPMREWANQAGVVSLELIPPFPRMQILTLEEVLNGKRPVLPYAEAA